MAWPCGMDKYDLHRHFGGCVSVETVAKLLGGQHTEESVRRQMVCTGRERSFRDFLARFDILNQIDWTEGAIATSIDQIVRDQAADGIEYSEISFSIDKYMTGRAKWTRPELIELISDVFRDACRRWRTHVNLILSLRMEATRASQLVNAALVRRHDVIGCLGGIDIVGDESKFDTRFYAPIFRDWRNAKKITLAHAGETCGAHNVFEAITILHVHRIRHGIAAAGDPEVMAAARDLNVCFDVSLHSNMLAGTTKNMEQHHLPHLLAAGCAVTLGTDDPVIFNCTLEDEYELGRRYRLFGADEDETIRQLRRNSIHYAAFSL